MRKKRMVFTAGIVLFFTSLASAYTIRLQWLPQTQFAGYYMAAEKGFYKEAGLDVDIKSIDPDVGSLRDLLYKGGDFETAWLSSGIIMKANSSKHPVLIAQFFQKPAFMLVAKKSSGIKTVRDFSGHSLGVWDGVFSVIPRVLIKKHNIPGIKIIPQGFTMESFLNGKIDIASAMRYNEYYQLMETGLKEDDLTVFDFAQLGISLPEDGLYVREDFLKANSEICKKVVAATLKGWRYAFENKEETVRYITDIANRTPFKTTPQKQGWMLYVVEKLMEPENISLKKEDFEGAADMLKSLKMIREKPSYESFYRNVMQQ